MLVFSADVHFFFPSKTHLSFPKRGKKKKIRSISRKVGLDEQVPELLEI